MLSICPHCVRTLGEDYKEFGANIHIEHHSQVLAKWKEDTPALPSGKTVVYHDPCYLGRYQEIYDEPRTIAAQAGNVVEAPRNHGRSFCCGAGGGLAFLGEETGARVSHTRAKELVDTGADIVAAACPFCQSETGERVKAGIFNDQFWGNVLLTLLPFPILLAVVALIYFDAPWPRKQAQAEADAAGPSTASPTTGD